MPRDTIVTLFKFHELTDSAQEKARDCFRQNVDFAWQDESLDSIKTFCARFGVTLTQWEVGPYAPSYWKALFDNSNFRGIKLRGLERESYPTDYCLDADMSIAFYDMFKRTGDAKYAFEHAVDAGFKAWRDDMEHQLSDEYIDELIEANDYEFYGSGELA